MMDRYVSRNRGKRSWKYRFTTKRKATRFRSRWYKSTSCYIVSKPRKRRGGYEIDINE